MAEDDLNRMLEAIIIEEFEAKTVAAIMYRHNVTIPAMAALEDAIVFAGRRRDVGSIHAMRDDWRN